MTCCFLPPGVWPCRTLLSVSNFRVGSTMWVDAAVSCRSAPACHVMSRCIMSCSPVIPLVPHMLSCCTQGHAGTHRQRASAALGLLGPAYVGLRRQEPGGDRHRAGLCSHCEGDASSPLQPRGHSRLLWWMFYPSMPQVGLNGSRAYSNLCKFVANRGRTLEVIRDVALWCGAVE